MIRLVATLYVGVIAALFGFIILLDLGANRFFDELIKEDIRRSVTSYTQLFEDIYVLAGEKKMEAAMYRTAALEDQVLTVLTDPNLLNLPELKALSGTDLFYGELAGVEETEEALYFRLSVNGKIYQARNAPNSEITRAEEMILEVSIWGVLIVTALALAGWIYLLQRKLKMLEVSARAIADGDFSARAPMAGRHRVGGLNRAFNLMAERVELLIASHKRLTNAVAHELRTPIFRLRCQLAMLEEDITSPVQRTYLSGMEEDLTELDQLIEELLSYAKMQRLGKREVFEAHDFALWLQAQQPLLQRSCLKPLAIEESPAVTLLFNERLLLRALSNLIRNADTHANTCIQMQAYIDNDYLVVCVDDDGQGVPESEHSRIFEPFERLDAARARDTGGHGLGLSIVREIAEIHQGFVRVSTSPLGGARFALYLPLSTQIQAQA